MPYATHHPRVFVLAPSVLCWGLERLVQSGHPRMEFAGSGSSLAECLPALVGAPPDVLLAADGCGALEQLAGLQGHIGTRVLLLTATPDLAAVDQAVISGIRGVVRASDPTAILLKAIEKVHAGEIWVDRCATGRIFVEMARQKAALANDPERLKIAMLTSRERQAIVAITVDTSAPAKVIADRLHISEHTLRNHLTSIYGKLQVSSRLDLYAYAARNHLDKAA